jgi:hypothetical protein
MSKPTPFVSSSIKLTPCTVAVTTGAFAAYGILSNLNAGVLVTIAWLAVVKQTGLTPIDPGQVGAAAAVAH